MSSAGKVSSTVSSRYASAFLDLAEQAKILDKVEKDLLQLKDMIGSSDALGALIRSPLIARGQQESAIQKIAEKAKFQKLTCNFLGLLAQNRRLYALPAIIRAVSKEISRRRGELMVTVETAQILTAAQTKALQTAVAKAVGQNVMLETKVNPEIMGGMIVTAGSFMIDDSVRRKLARLRGAMTGGANQNLNLKDVG